MKTNAGIYARISEDRDESQAGVGRQLEDCTELADKRSWDVVDRYVDNDISAYKGGRRPEWERLLTDIADGRINAVVVYHQDRLLRQPRDLERFFDVCDRAGVTLLASASGNIDLSSGDGKLKARIMGAVAANSSDAMSRRLRRKALEIAKNGGVAGGGRRPFGFERDRVTIRPDEAEVIRDLAKRFLAGDSLRSLCVDLKAHGTHTPSDGDWEMTPMRNMLRSARISGQREHRGEIIAKAVWPAIITPKQTADIRALLDSPDRKAKRSPRGYVLRGVAHCGCCDESLVSRPTANGTRRYVCATGPRYVGCGRINVTSEPLEELATEAVFAALDSPELAAAVRGQALASPNGEWQRQADEVQRRLDELAEAFAATEITMREWQIAREPLQQQLERARRRVARDSHMAILAEHMGNGRELRAKWPTLSIERRHAVVAALLLRVDVAPVKVRGLNRFDPSRAELIWRH